jgi:hypothetical protein
MVRFGFHTFTVYGFSKHSILRPKIKAPLFMYHQIMHHIVETCISNIIYTGTILDKNCCQQRSWEN